MRYVSGPAYVRSAEVPRRVLRDIIAVGLGGEMPPARRYAKMCAWAERFGGDVVVQFTPDDPATVKGPDGGFLAELRFVVPW